MNEQIERNETCKTCANWTHTHNFAGIGYGACEIIDRDDCHQDHGCDNYTALSALSLVYLQEDGTEVFVSSGLGGDTYGTFTRRASGSLKRVCSKHMPMVETRDEAQRNLDAWARRAKLERKVQ